MSDKEYKMVQISKQEHGKLRELAENQKRSMSNQLEWLIDQEHEKIFRVISVEQLPHPEGAEPVPLLTVEPV